MGTPGAGDAAVPDGDSDAGLDAGETTVVVLVVVTTEGS